MPRTPRPSPPPQLGELPAEVQKDRTIITATGARRKGGVSVRGGQAPGDSADAKAAEKRRRRSSTNSSGGPVSPSAQSGTVRKKKDRKATPSIEEEPSAPPPSWGEWGTQFGVGHGGMNMGTTSDAGSVDAPSPRKKSTSTGPGKSPSPAYSLMSIDEEQQGGGAAGGDNKGGKGAATW